jgi:HEAT repeat protein
MIWILAAALITGLLPEEEGIRRVQAHLLIEDSPSALTEAEQLATLYPDSRKVHKTLIEALAANGLEEQALNLWNQLTVKDPNLLYDRHLLEELAWGVLKKGTRSTQYGVRLAATIGAYLTKDTRAVSILLKMMRDSNAVIRSVAVQMSASYRDAPLKDEIIRLMRDERIWMVRLEVIKAAGLLKIKELTSALQALVQSEKTTFEERQIAITSLLEMYDRISLPELMTLARSNRAGLRHLACSIAAHFQMEEARDEIIRLIQDSNPAVRIAALNAFGLIYKGKETDVVKALEDSDPAVAITASWAAMIIGSEQGALKMKKWLFDSLPENRRLAAAALASVGSLGVNLARQVLKESNDPYVKANLALGLLGQRVEVATCCDLLYDFLEREKRLLMLDKKPNPLFEAIAPSQIRYNDQIPNHPEAQDQLTRLSLVSQLALVEDPRALDALKSFLQRKNWGISGVAAATLLHEGDDSSLEVVKQLLNDPDANVRLQACLVLAMFGKDESVLRDLQGAYAEADHEKKLHILEALGRIGNAQSYSFLVGVFKEPFPILRVAAAAALIQSVNR